MNKKPKISVITVCYNSEQNIEEAIKSVINQTYDNLEYIIVDGGSTDSTLDIVNKYRNKIAVVISEPDKGISDAFNKGIRAATGDLIGICNSDDIMYNNEVLEKVASYYSDDFDIYRGTEIVKNTETGYEYQLSPTLEIKRNPIKFHTCHMAAYIKKSAYEKYGYYNVNLKYSMDIELLYRMMNAGAKTTGMDVIVGEFHLGGVSQTHSKDRKKESITVLKNINASAVDIFIYSFCLSLKSMLRRCLDIFGVDAASRIRYGRKHR